MIAVKCSLCGNELDEPGGLAFSPPSFPFDMVDKFHVCRTCWWEKFRPALLGQITLDQKIVPTIFKEPFPNEEEIAESLRNIDRILGAQKEGLENLRDMTTDAVEHTHGDKAPWVTSSRSIPSARRRVEVPHTHAWGSHPHNHFLRAICGRPECAEFPTHNIHYGPDKKKFLDAAIDNVRIRGDGTVLFGDDDV